ncbi:MAG: signal recognition particle-docking protein FtsY [Clostridia bacterium]|nr:signal recognition particle-docking protein FtsY [Clostridia bacterium]
MALFNFGKKKREQEEAARREQEQAAAAAAPVSEPVMAPIQEETVREEPVQEEKKGLFSRLWQGLSKTRTNVSGRVDELIEATEEIDDDFYEDLVDILIMSDMGVRTSDKVITELRRRIDEQHITDARKARDILKQILKDMMNKERKPLQWPMVMLVVGVNGVGKTTTIGKLALRFKDARHSVVLAAADTFRAAAADQLEIWAQRAQVPLVRHAEGADPAAVVFDGIKKAQGAEADLLIVDTAGRLHNKKNLMEELRKISRIITREYENADVRTLLVIDATTGQNGLQQAREFSEVADVSGIVLTKLDGTAKGGIAVAIMEELGLPVLYIGVGEGIEDLQAFDAEAFVDAIF